MQTSYTPLLLIALPEIIVTCAAILVLMLDVSVLREQALRTRFAVASGLASLGCAAAIFVLWRNSTDAFLSNGMLLSSPLSRLTSVGILVLSIFALLLSMHSSTIEHVGEYVLLVLLATVGMMALVSTQNLVTIFASLELLSLSLYLLTAFDRNSVNGAEASLKYFLFGGMSAAVLLYGFSMLYGFADSTDLMVIGAAVARHGAGSIVILALVTTTIGFGFKIAAAPLHFWVPDVYEAAPSPVVGFIASVSKLASFYALFVVLTVAFGAFTGTADWFHVTEGWVPVVALFATLSMVVGNTGALAQHNVRRLLGYSAIAHSGYMLIALASHTSQSLSSLLFYLLSYGVTVLGTFAITGIVEQQAKGGVLSDFNGLSRRAPLLSFCMFIFLLSQAGIPPLSGFFAKFYLFVAAVHGNGGDRGLLWIVVVALAMSAVSLYYYLGILKRVFVADPPVEFLPIECPLFTKSVVLALALFTVALGCFPNVALHWIEIAVDAASR